MACRAVLAIAPERPHDEKLDERENVLFARVVGADLRALGGVKRALEEGAEDGRLDAAPVVGVNLDQDLDFVGAKLDRVGVVEQAAVEVQDGVDAEVAAAGHGGKEPGEHVVEPGRVVAVLVEHAVEELFGEQADILGEHAEHQLHEEMSGAVGVDLALAEPVGQQREALGGLLGDRFGGEAGAAGVGVGEELAERVEVDGLVEVGKARRRRRA
jgi:hypothetical protein